jgi:glutathione reductase (NADPH)
MAKNFDVIAIGTGSAASAAAHKCRGAGLSVAVVDSRPFGGTCALRGCDPKKVLVGAAELLDWNRRMSGKGVVTSDVHLDWSELMRFKRTFTKPVPQNREKSFAKAGIATFHGRAHFVGSTSLVIGDETLVGKYVVIGAGAKPATLGIPGEELLTTSETFLELEHLPKKIIFVVGGYISFEFAHIAARVGSEVVVLHRGNRPLEGFDNDLVNTLVHPTREIGVDLRLKTAVTAIEKSSGHLLVRALAEGSEQTFEADLVVHGAGREPDIDDLGLNQGDVARSGKGVLVNEYLQSISNPAVYAAGDAVATEGLPLTPVASQEGHVVAANILKGNQRSPDYKGTPTVVFTIPPLASVGLQEEAARERGFKFTVKHENTSSWYSSRRVNLRHSGYKVLVEKDSGKILGAHLLGLHAEEVINLFALAIRTGLKADDLRRVPYGYPSSSSDVSYMV